MAIVHVVVKSSSSAPPSAAHADYISRAGKYGRRGGVELAESGNMPEFAQSDPRAFWTAADMHERANGRSYREIQIALPRELGSEQRKELAQEVVREFMGDRFAYTVAVHTPVAKDNIEQPHLHLMFSERVVDERTRLLPEDQFFKRNGAKKDRDWNDRSAPERIRAQWCEMMNRAMEREGIETRVDPRSWADQGREDLAALREPKTLGGDGADAVELRKEIEQKRELRKALPEPGLDQVAALQKLEAEAEARIAEIEMKMEEELSLIDRLITKAKEKLAQAVEWGQGFLSGSKMPVFARMSRAPIPAEEQSGTPPPVPPPEADAVEQAAEARQRVWEAERERNAAEEARQAEAEARFEARQREWERQQEQREQEEERRKVLEVERERQQRQPQRKQPDKSRDFEIGD